jgi:hypothetical protein
MTLRTAAYGTLLLMTAFAGIACDDDKKFNETKSTNIAVTPRDIVYSPVPIGQQSIGEAIEIRQDGETVLTVTNIYLESEQFPGAKQCDRVALELGRNDALPTELDESCHFIIEERGGSRAFPWKLGNNESLVVNVAYRSIGATSNNWKLVIESNGLNQPRAEVTLRVRAEQPAFGGTELINFPIDGGQEFGVIRNIGTGLLNVSNLRVEYLTAQPIDPETQMPIDEFRVRADRELPWNIDNQTTQTLTISYNPVDEEADTAEVVFTSDNADEGEYRIRLTSEAIQSVIDVQPTPAIFGQPTAAEGNKRVELIIANRGLKSFDVRSLLIDQPSDDYRLDNAPSSFQLRGGQTQSVIVIYEPSDDEGTDATLLITSTADVGADDQMLTHVPLVRSGDSLPAVLDIEPPVVAMNEVASGSSATQTVVISNPGAQVLEISDIAFSGPDGELPASDSEFNITSGGGAVNVAPGGEHTVTVELTRPADDRRALFGLLLIESNAPPSPATVYFTSSPVAQ